MRLVHGNSGGGTRLLGSAPFDRDFGRLVLHQNGTEDRVLARSLVFPRKRATDAAAKSQHEIAWDRARAQKRVCRRPRIDQERLDLACHQAKRHHTNGAKRRARLGDHRHSAPDDAVVQTHVDRLASRFVTRFRVVGQNDAPVLKLEAVKRDEQILAVEHPEQVGALDHDADAPALLGMVNERAHFADALRRVLPSHDANVVEFLGCDEIACHFVPGKSEGRAVCSGNRTRALRPFHMRSWCERVVLLLVTPVRLRRHPQPAPLPERPRPESLRRPQPQTPRRS